MADCSGSYAGTSRFTNEVGESMNGIKLIELWNEVKARGDITEMSMFLYQNCQEALRIVESQGVVIDYLNDIIFEQDEHIQELEEDAI